MIETKPKYHNMTRLLHGRPTNRTQKKEILILSYPNPLPIIVVNSYTPKIYSRLGAEVVTGHW